MDDLRQEVARLDAMVEQAKAAFRFAERREQLADAMRDYLNELDAPARDRWGVGLPQLRGSPEPWAHLLADSPTSS